MSSRSNVEISWYGNACEVITNLFHNINSAGGNFSWDIIIRKYISLQFEKYNLILCDLHTMISFILEDNAYIIS